IHRSVRHIYVVYVIAAHAIGRHIHLARSQRKPPDTLAGRVTSAADSNPDRDVWASHPRHQRGRVDGTHVDNALNPDRGRHPAPRSLVRNPPAIMKWRKSPRFVIHPRIAPRLDIVPVAIVVGSPTRDGRARKPYIAVVGCLAPRAVII